MVCAGDHGRGAALRRRTGIAVRDDPDPPLRDVRPVRRPHQLVLAELSQPRHPQPLGLPRQERYQVGPKDASWRMQSCGNTAVKG